MSGVTKSDEKRTPSAAEKKGSGKGKSSSEGGAGASGVPRRSKKEGLA
jgi:hypothetical protein